MVVDTSTTPYISPVLETETMTALMLRYVEGQEEVAYEYAMVDTRVWPRLARLAMDAYLAHAILEVAFVPVVDEETDTDSRALLYRLAWPY